MSVPTLTRPFRRCTTPGCDRPHRARGLCYRCYRIAERNGTLPPRSPRPDRCITEGCTQAPDWGDMCVEHRAQWRPSERTEDVRPIDAPLHGRTKGAAPRQVERAREALRTATDPEVIAILRARVDMPTATMATIAATLGLSRDAYWGRLRRALRSPSQREREIARTRAFDAVRTYYPHGRAGYVGSCDRRECGARQGQLRHFYVGDAACAHVAVVA